MEGWGSRGGWWDRTGVSGWWGRGIGIVAKTLAASFIKTEKCESNTLRSENIPTKASLLERVAVRDGVEVYCYPTHTECEGR